MAHVKPSDLKHSSLWDVDRKEDVYFFLNFNSIAFVFGIIIQQKFSFFTKIYRLIWSEHKMPMISDLKQPSDTFLTLYSFNCNIEKKKPSWLKKKQIYVKQFEAVLIIIIEITLNNLITHFKLTEIFFFNEINNRKIPLMLFFFLQIIGWFSNNKKKMLYDNVNKLYIVPKYYYCIK